METWKDLTNKEKIEITKEKIQEKIDTLKSTYLDKDIKHENSTYEYRAFILNGINRNKAKIESLR
jgi:hypothetical protein